jgi:NAD(P)H-dependent FMN reductase
MARQPTVRVAALNGSPHREGNTATLLRWVVAGCEEAGAEVDWIDLVDHDDIGCCRGCMTCLRMGACAVQDGFQAVRDRLVAADGIVVGTPVYSDRPTARLATFIDRATVLNLFTDTFGGKRSVGVATSGLAPTGGVARKTADLFGQRSGHVGARTATFEHGYRALSAETHPGLPTKARAVGRKLVGDVVGPARLRVPGPFTLWVWLLRRVVLRRFVTRHADQFAGVLRIWRERRLL